MNFSIRRRLPFALLVVALTALSSLSGLRAASADDPACKMVLAAAAKMGQTDHHEFMTERTGDTTTEGESIQVGGTSYIKVDGAWHQSLMSPKDAATAREENLRDSKVFSCHYERDEAVNGEAAAVYKSHQESDDAKADAEVWISESRGLVLKEVVNHPDDKITITIRVDYTNVQEPATVK